MSLSNDTTVADFHRYQYDLNLQQETDAVSSQSAAAPNNQKTQEDEAAGQLYLTGGDLDRSQTFAKAGTAVPIVFCRVNASGTGGVWLSPPLVDTISDDFIDKFIYLISQGDCGINSDPKYYYLGDKNVQDQISAGNWNTPVFENSYTANPAVCPLDAHDCTHKKLYLQIDPLSPEIGSSVVFRTLGDYADRLIVRLLPQYDGVAPGALETYRIDAELIDNFTGTVSTFYNITTTPNGTFIGPDVTFNTATSSYTYIFTISSVAAASSYKPSTILVEVQQRNDSPDDPADRIAQYAGISFLEVTGNLWDLSQTYSPATDLKQLHIFVNTGVEVTQVRYVDPADPSQGVAYYTNQSSDSFGDLLYYYFTTVLDTKYSQYGSEIYLIRPEDLARGYLFWDEYDIRFNGIVGSTTNFLSFAQETAPFFLSKFYNDGGQYRLKRVLPIKSLGLINDGELTPQRVFSDIETGEDTTDNTFLPGSYVKTYFDPSRRLPVQLTVSWRNNTLNTISFSRTTNIRYSDYPYDSPIESYDMSNFCTNASHVEIFAKHLLATRRYSTHQIAFQTLATFDAETPENNLEVMDLIEVVIHRVNSAGDNTTETNHYLVDSIVTGSNNVVTITATHHPLDPEGGFSIINNEILTASFDIV